MRYAEVQAPTPCCEFNMDGPEIEQKMDGNNLVVLDCSVRGVPRPKVSWQKDGVTLVEERLRGRLELAAGGAVLRVNLVDPVKDGGVYSCTAENLVDMCNWVSIVQAFHVVVPTFRPLA